MSDENKTNNAWSSGNVADEFRTLGNQLKDILQSTWESEERKKLQSEIVAGLDDLANSLRQASADFAQSPTGQQLKKDVQDLQERARSGELESKARSELLNALRLVNAELEKVRGSIKKP